MDVKEVTYKGISLDKWFDRVQAIENAEKKRKADEKKVLEKYKAIHAKMRGV